MRKRHYSRPCIELFPAPVSPLLMSGGGVEGSDVNLGDGGNASGEGGTGTPPPLQSKEHNTLWETGYDNPWKTEYDVW